MLNFQYLRVQLLIRSLRASELICFLILLLSVAFHSTNLYLLSKLHRLISFLQWISVGLIPVVFLLGGLITHYARARMYGLLDRLYHEAWSYKNFMESGEQMCTENENRRRILDVEVGEGRVSQGMVSYPREISIPEIIHAINIPENIYRINIPEIIYIE